MTDRQALNWKSLENNLEIDAKQIGNWSVSTRAYTQWHYMRLLAKLLRPVAVYSRISYLCAKGLNFINSIECQRRLWVFFLATFLAWDDQTSCKWILFLLYRFLRFPSILSDIHFNPNISMKIRECCLLVWCADRFCPTQNHLTIVWILLNLRSYHR